MHKGFKCLDPTEGRIYVSRDVVFDEHVFPFSTMRPNVGALLKAELRFLLDLSFHSSGDGNLLDPIVTSPLPTNHSQSSFGDLPPGGENSGPNGGEMSQNGATHGDNSGGHRVCPLAGSGETGSRSHADMPRQTVVGASESSPGFPSQSSAGDNTGRQPGGAGSSTAGAVSPHSSLGRASPQTDPQRVLSPSSHTPASAVEADSTGSGVAPARSGAATSSVIDSTATPDTDSSHAVTRLQRGISKPKVYTDGTVRWCNHTIVMPEEPTSVEAALDDPKWVEAMDSEHEALLHNSIKPGWLQKDSSNAMGLIMRTLLALW
jgi:hypothetical protein